jgi:hypothetical protein
MGPCWLSDPDLRISHPGRGGNLEAWVSFKWCRGMGEAIGMVHWGEKSQRASRDGRIRIWGFGITIQASNEARSLQFQK